METGRCIDGLDFINLRYVSGPIKEEGRLYRLEDGSYGIISGAAHNRDIRPLVAFGNGVYGDQQRGAVWEETRVPVPGWQQIDQT